MQISALLEDAPTRCDALKMARSIFPFILQDSALLGNGMDNNANGHNYAIRHTTVAPTALLTKYHFYHYTNATCIACGQPELCQPAYKQRKSVPGTGCKPFCLISDQKWDTKCRWEDCRKCPRC